MRPPRPATAKGRSRRRTAGYAELDAADDDANRRLKGNAATGAASWASRTPEPKPRHVGLLLPRVEVEIENRLLHLVESWHNNRLFKSIGLGSYPTHDKPSHAEWIYL